MTLKQERVLRTDEIPSKLNFLSDEEISINQVCGIEILIDKLNEIKKDPCFLQIKAVSDFADRLASIDGKSRKRPSYIRFIDRTNLWQTRRVVKGHLFSKISKDKRVCIDAYINFCREKGIRYEEDVKRMNQRKYNIV